MFKLLTSTSVYNPFEVIVALLSLFISLSLISSTNNSTANATQISIFSNVKHEFNRLFNLKNDEITEIYIDEAASLNDNRSSSNFIFIMILRCLAFICIFIQFKSLKKMHSKFILCNLNQTLFLFKQF